MLRTGLFRRHGHDRTASTCESRRGHLLCVVCDLVTGQKISDDESNVVCAGSRVGVDGAAHETLLAVAELPLVEEGRIGGDRFAEIHGEGERRCSLLVDVDRRRTDHDALLLRKRIRENRKTLDHCGAVTPDRRDRDSLGREGRSEPEPQRRRIQLEKRIFVVDVIVGNPVAVPVGVRIDVECQGFSIRVDGSEREDLLSFVEDNAIGVVLRAWGRRHERRSRSGSRSRGRSLINAIARLHIEVKRPSHGHGLFAARDLNKQQIFARLNQSRAKNRAAFRLKERTVLRENPRELWIGYVMHRQNLENIAGGERDCFLGARCAQH